MGANWPRPPVSRFFGANVSPLDGDRPRRKIWSAPTVHAALAMPRDALLHRGFPGLAYLKDDKSYDNR
jgi:hypothetical protein